MTKQPGDEDIEHSESSRAKWSEASKRRAYVIAGLLLVIGLSAGYLSSVYFVMWGPGPGCLNGRDTGIYAWYCSPYLLLWVVATATGLGALPGLILVVGLLWWHRKSSRTT